MTLPKKEKLKNHLVFKNLKSLNLLNKNKFFILLGRPWSDKVKPKVLDFPQIAFIVSKKKVKLAVNRNKAKRRLGEAYRILQPELKDKIQRFQYLVFLLHENIVNAKLTDLIDCLKKIKFV